MVYGNCRTPLKTISDASNPNNLYSGVYFGSGTTPAKMGDYKLESVINSGLSIVSSNLRTRSSGEVNIVYAHFILENTTENNITVSELGIFTPICNRGVSSFSEYTSYYNVLMERTVLESPVVIAPGEFKTITYQITFNQSVS
jgi:hypothetical protein